MLHKDLFNRNPSLILNIDETMLSAKKRFKVLAKKGILPLVPENVKLPHFTGCVTFSAFGHLFDSLIILPNKKTMRTLNELNKFVYFASTMAGWMTTKTFIYYCILLVCQISYYRLTLPDDLKDQSILLLVGGHPSRFSFLACYILYLFNIDLVLIPPHTSHILQAFDVGIASPLKTYFKEYLVSEKFDDYLEKGTYDFKQTAKQMKNTMIRAFINVLQKCCTINNIENSFKKTGICPLDSLKPLNSEFTIRNENWDPDQLLRNYLINGPESLRELFLKENGREISDNDFDINLGEIFNDLKTSSIEDGRALSNPPLFEELQNSIMKLTF